MDFRKINFQRSAGIVVTFGGIFLLLLFFFRRLIGILLPFLLAWGVAFLVRPLSYSISRRCRIPQKVVSVVLTVLTFFALGAGVFWIGSRLWHEILALLQYLSEHPDIFENSLSDLRHWLGELRMHLPFAQRGEERALPVSEEELLSMMGTVLSGAATSLTRAIGNFLLCLPSAFLFVLITVIAAVYFALDLKGINRAVLCALPDAMRAGLSRFKRGVCECAAVYMRSYTILFFLTFALLLVGFLILKIRYALLLAFLFAFLDLLPVIGVGTLLVPWGIFCCFGGKGALGVCLFALYLIIAVIRQIVEPRLLGGRLGLHPLLTLFAMYAGLKLLGLLGMILGPLFAVLLRAVLRNEPAKEEIRQ